MYEILKKEMFSEAICLMEVHAPRVANSAKPGQFVIVRVGEKGERIPLTICDFDVKKGTVTIVIQIVGASSRKICALSQGDCLTDFVGPLGQPSEFVEMSDEELKTKSFIFIAGGLGTAPVYPQAKYLFNKGAHVEVILGAKTKSLVIMEKEMSAVCHKLHICTDDGSYGFNGLVTAKLKELLDAGNKFDCAVAIGPMIMMKFVTLTAKPYNLPLIVSLNTLMVDGTGMCGACRVTVGGKTKFACVDGPEFNAYEVDFDEALRRGGQYKEQEKEAADHVCRALAAWDKKKRVPVREQEPLVRAKNFDEVCLGYNKEEAMKEASRCLNCKIPKCMQACPVNVKIPMFIHEVAQGNFAEAARIIAIDSSLPAICGRVCPQERQCEGSCIMGVKNEPIAIGKLERFVADTARMEAQNGNAPAAPEIKKNGKKVAIVGSGPCGLACAVDLAKAGVDVTIFESLHTAGGVLAYGIPEFRLPKKKIVAYEVEQVKKLGVKIETNVVIGRTVTIDQLFDDEKFDAVFIGSGAGLPKFMGIPGENLNGVVSANEFLTRNNLMCAYDKEAETPIYVGKKVVVVGGGNVAMDAARTALRLGAEVHIVYRRTLEEMPARVEEVHHAMEEGIHFDLLRNPVEVIGTDKGWVKSVKCIKMELGEPDASGRRSPVEVPGSEFEIDCDVVIIALGTVSNPLLAKNTPGLNTNKKNCIEADAETLATSRAHIYAGGDAVSGAATVILAMGAGRKGAASILKDLGL